MMAIGHREKGKRLPSLSEDLRIGSKRNKLFDSGGLAGLDSESQRSESSLTASFQSC